MRHHFQHKDALYALYAQAIAIVVLLPIIWIAWQAQAALSAMIGGLVCLLPNIYLYRRVFAYFGATKAKLIVKAMFWGESVKIILTALFFIGALLIGWTEPMWVFMGYIWAQLSFWVGPIILNVRRALKN